MRTLGVICTLFLMVSGLIAQTGVVPKGTPHRIPAGALILPRAPIFSKWSVTCSPAKAAGSQSGQRRMDTLLVITKTKDIMYEQTVDAWGGKKEKWCAGALQYSFLPGSNRWTAFDRGAFVKNSANGAYYSDYSSTDFPEAAWVSAKNYVDIVKYSGRDCLFFKDILILFSKDELKEINEERAKAHQSPLTADDCIVAVAAYVDLETRLPVMCQRGDEVRLFKFMAPPQAMLVLPPEVQKDLKRRANDIELLSRMPARPF